MIKFSVLCLLLTTYTYSSDIPTSWIIGGEKETKESFNKSNELSEGDLESLENKVEKIYETNNRIVERISNRFPLTERFDIGFGVTTSGSIGIFSVGASKAIEFIWEREEEKVVEPSTSEKTISLYPNMKEGEIQYLLVKNLEAVIDFDSLKPSVRRRIIRTLYKDASRINLLAKTMYKTRQVGHWYTRAFWRIYNFSSSYGILDDLSVGYAKRVRFRFNLNQSPYRYSDGEDSKPSKLLFSLMKRFNEVSNRDSSEDNFWLYRVFTEMSFNVSGDVLVFSKSIGTGYLLDFRRTDKFVPYDHVEDDFKLSSKVVTKVTNYINKFVSKLNTDTKGFPLSQIRYSFAVSSEFDVLMASVEKEAEIQFHFKRVSESNLEKSFFSDLFDTSMPDDMHSDKPIAKLSQVDYRHRASFSFKVPFVDRIRVRPSYEFRYEPAD